MATITLQIVTGSGTLTRSKTLSAGDASRLLAAYKALYGQIQTGTNPDGTPILRDRTNQEIVNALGDGIIQGMADNVKRYEQEVAAKTSRDAVADVALT